MQDTNSSHSILPVELEYTEENFCDDESLSLLSCLTISTTGSDEQSDGEQNTLIQKVQDESSPSTSRCSEEPKREYEENDFRQMVLRIVQQIATQNTIDDDIKDVMSLQENIDESVLLKVLDMLGKKPPLDHLLKSNMKGEVGSLLFVYHLGQMRQYERQSKKGDTVLQSVKEETQSEEDGQTKMEGREEEEERDVEHLQGEEGRVLLNRESGGEKEEKPDKTKDEEEYRREIATKIVLSIIVVFCSLIFIVLSYFWSDMTQNIQRFNEQVNYSIMYHNASVEEGKTLEESIGCSINFGHKKKLLSCGPWYFDDLPNGLQITNVTNNRIDLQSFNGQRTGAYVVTNALWFTLSVFATATLSYWFIVLIKKSMYYPLSQTIGFRKKNKVESSGSQSTQTLTNTVLCCCVTFCHLFRQMSE